MCRTRATVRVTAAPVPLTVGRYPPTPLGHEPSPQPLPAPLSPSHRPPRRGGQALQDGIDPLGRRVPGAEGHGEIAADRDHIGFTTLLQAGQEVRIIPVIGIGGDAGVANPPAVGLVQQREGDLRLGFRPHEPVPLEDNP